MLGNIIKAIIMFIIFCYIQKIINDLHKSEKVKSSENDTEFMVRIPGALTYVYAMLCIMGIIMFVVFFVVKFLLHHTDAVDSGCFILSMIISAIGLIVASYSWNWRISVNGEEMKIHRLFHKDKKVKISEIEKTVIQKKKVSQAESTRIILYKNGHKLIKVENLMENYDNLFSILKRYNKIID